MTTRQIRLSASSRLVPILTEMRDGISTGRADIIDVVNNRLRDYADRIEEAIVQDMIDTSWTCHLTFADRVREMREAQRAYFKTRSHDDLRRAKNLERKVDLTLSTIGGEVPEQGELPL